MNPNLDEAVGRLTELASELSKHADDYVNGATIYNNFLATAALLDRRAADLRLLLTALAGARAALERIAAMQIRVNTFSAAQIAFEVARDIARSAGQTPLTQKEPG